jgi:ABC-type nitrate/sulfonate/bicarbonate transport system substrate-binding protein
MSGAPRRRKLTFCRNGARFTALLICLLAICPTVDAQPSQPTRVRIGLAGRNFSFLPFFVAEQQKFFEQEGIRAEMIYMRSPVAIPALSAGEIQYTTHFASVVRSAVKGFPVRVVLSTSDRQMFSLVTAKSIKRIEDLKGKAVAVSNPLGIHAYVTLQILKKFGLDPGKDPRFLYLGEESAWSRRGRFYPASDEPGVETKGLQHPDKCRRSHRVARHRIVDIR